MGGTRKIRQQGPDNFFNHQRTSKTAVRTLPEKQLNQGDPYQYFLGKLKPLVIFHGVGEGSGPPPPLPSRSTNLTQQKQPPGLSLFCKQVKKRSSTHDKRFHRECEGRIDKSVPRIAVWHHEACRVMTNGDHEGRIFLSYPHTNNGFFFLLTNASIYLF